MNILGSNSSATSTSHPLAEAIYETLETICGSSEFVPLHEPLFEGNEWAYVKDCLDTGWVSTAGKYVDAFEQKLIEFTEIPHAIAVVNGTSALHVGLLLCGVESGQEVLVPATTFIATANAVAYTGAVPHFVDCDQVSLGVDVDELESYLRETTVTRNGQCINKYTGRPITALIAVHVFGHAVNMTSLCHLCDRLGIAVIEDAAEALGSRYEGTHVGGFGRLAALSFNGNKTITSGGGGAILTRDQAVAKAAKHLTTTAKVPHSWEFIHDEVGYNYRLPNINAALGVAQLEQLDSFLDRKRRLFQIYRAAFEKVEGVSVLEGPSHSQGNYWLNALVLEEAAEHARDDILTTTNARGIMTRPLWTPPHLLPMYQHCPRMSLTTAEQMRRRVIAIPSGPKLIN